MTTTALLIAFAVGVLASLIGGVIGGMIVGGKHIGYELSAIMGGFYGPVAGIMGVAAGLAILYFM